MSASTERPVSPASSPDPQPLKTSKGLACIFCQTRKVKCDRQRPCGTCTKARITCTYRARKTPRRLQSKANEVSLRARLGRLEDLLKTAVSRNEVVEAELSRDDRDDGQVMSGGDSLSTQMQQMLDIDGGPGKRGTYPIGSDPRFAQGQLFSDQGKSRYIENKLWNKIHDALKDAQAMLDEESSDEDPDPKKSVSSPSDSLQDDLVFGARSSAKSLHSLHPPPVNINALWTAFVDNVNPLTRIVHVPTGQQMIAEAIADIDSVPKETAALLFSIYHIGVFSLQNSECEQLLGESQATLLTRYRFATERALLNANYLKSSDLKVLQAFALYLLATRQYYDARSFWAISGLAFRMAQRIGIHKDAAEFGLSPFECQMRRRLWWQIIFIEVRAAEVCGVSFTSMVAIDHKPPLNVNDEDLWPEMEQDPLEREGPTEMCFIMLRTTIGRYFAYLYRSALSESDKAGAEHSAQTLDSLMGELSSLLHERFLVNADPLNPLQFFTSMVARAILCSWRVMSSIRRANEKQEALSNADRDILFEESLKSIEYDNLGHTTPNVQRFAWHVNSHFQWHSFISLLNELRARPRGELVERAWSQVEETFDHHPEILSTKNALHTAVCTLTLAGWQCRETDYINKYQMPLAVPQCVSKIRQQRAPRNDSKGKLSPLSQQTIESLSSVEIDERSSHIDFRSFNGQLSGDQTVPFSNMGTMSFDFSQPPNLANPEQMDWSLWDNLLQNYELPPPMEETDFLLPKSGSFGGFYQ